jgi:single-strand DNA-binding protein
MENKAIILGNVGSDPEIKHLDGGNAVANFSVATSETYKDKSGEKKTETEWHRVVIWGKLAEIVEKYVKKGQQLYLVGKIKTRKWTDKDGNDKFTTEILCNQMLMIGKKDAPASEEASDEEPF